MIDHLAIIERWVRSFIERGRGRAGGIFRGRPYRSPCCYASDECLSSVADVALFGIEWPRTIMTSKEEPVHGITKKRFRPSMVARDRSELPVITGYLLKQSRKKVMQRRYFETNNHYLNYYQDDKKKRLLCSYDLLFCLDVEVVNRFGDIELDFGDVSVCLRAADDDEAADWCRNLQTRQRMYASLPQYQKRTERILSDATQKTTGVGVPLTRKNSLGSADKADLHQGFLKKKSPSRFRGWQDRFFRLYEGEIRYYKTEPKDLNDLDAYAGNFLVAEILSVQPAATAADRENHIFTIHMINRDFDLQASSTEDLDRWLGAFQIAMEHAKVQEAENAAEESTEGGSGDARQRKESVVNKTQDPKFIRYFDSQDPGTRVETLMQQSVDAFENIMVDTVDAVMEVCTEIMDDLSDVSDACLSCTPPRYDVFVEYLTFYHGTLLFKVADFTNGAEVGTLEAHEALRLMDFMLAYIDLINKSFKDCTDEEVKVRFDTSGFTDQLGFLRSSYCAKAKPTLMTMCSNIAKLVLKDQEKAIVEGRDGHYHTAAPIDLFNMINEYVRIAGRGGMKDLQVDVIRMCLSAIVHYHDEVKAGIVGFAEPENCLLFLVAVINDCDNIGDNIDSQIEEEHEELLEGSNIEDRLDEVRMECQSLSRFALGTIRRVIFADTGELEASLFNDWEGQETLEILLETIDDYLGDFSPRLVEMAHMTLVGFCFTECIILYAQNLLGKFTKKDKSGVLVKGKTELSVDQAGYVLRDMETIRASFAAHFPEDGEDKAKKLFRQQWSTTCDIADVLQMECDNLEHDVFVRVRSSLGLTKKDISPFVYAFVASFLLIRPNLTDAARIDVLKGLHKLMEAEGFTLDHLKLKAEEIELRDRQMSEAEMEGRLPPANVARKMVEDDGLLLVQQLFPKAHTQCVYDYDRERRVLTSMASRLKGALTPKTGEKGGKSRPASSVKSFSRALAAFGSGLKKKSSFDDESAKKKVKKDLEMPDEAKKAVYKLFVDGVISKEEYETMINKHKDFQDEALQQAMEEKKQAQEDAETLAKAQAGPLQNAKDLLREGHISQEEYAELVRTIEAANAHLDDSGHFETPGEKSCDSSFSKKRKSSISTHDPLLATRKMLEQGVITQIEYDEIAGTIMAGQMLYDSDKKPQRTPSSSTAAIDGTEDAPILDSELVSSPSNSAGDDLSEIGNPFLNGLETLPDLPEDPIDFSSTPEPAILSPKVSRSRLSADRMESRANIKEIGQKMRGYLEKRHKKIHRKWDRRWFSIQTLKHEGMGRPRTSLAWHRTDNAPVAKSIPIMFISRVWCEVQPGCLITNDGSMKLPHQLPENLRVQISDDDVRRGKKNQKNMFHILMCSGTEHERTLTVKARSTASMVDWVNNLNCLVKLVMEESSRGSTGDTRRESGMMRRVSMIVDNMDDDGGRGKSFDELVDRSLKIKSPRSPSSSIDSSVTTPRSNGDAKRKKNRSNRSSFMNVEPVSKETEGKVSVTTNGELAAVLDELEALHGLGEPSPAARRGLGVSVRQHRGIQLNTKSMLDVTDWENDEQPLPPASQGCACVIA